ncbi:Enolase 1 [Zea mays]|uniref:Enolase 1 n=1 Tax=Zea mays TaxID=4577 RepID=A0A3L6F173_MAIZE|nr:Enolase 1 [Zea mays]
MEGVLPMTVTPPRAFACFRPSRIRHSRARRNLSRPSDAPAMPATLPSPQVDVGLSDGSYARGAIPSGASTGASRDLSGGISRSIDVVWLRDMFATRRVRLLTVRGGFGTIRGSTLKLGGMGGSWRWRQRHGVRSV